MIADGRAREHFGASIPAFHFPPYIAANAKLEINQGTELCPHCGADLTVPIGARISCGETVPAKILLSGGACCWRSPRRDLEFLWFVVPDAKAIPPRRPKSRAVESLRQVRSAWRTTHGTARSLPRSSRRWVNRCARQGNSRRASNTRFQYTPGPVEPDGSIRSYELQARAGNYGFLSFYTDIRRGACDAVENRAATAQDSPY